MIEINHSLVQVPGFSGHMFLFLHASNVRTFHRIISYHFVSYRISSHNSLLVHLLIEFKIVYQETWSGATPYWNLQLQIFDFTDI